MYPDMDGTVCEHTEDEDTARPPSTLILSKSYVDSRN